ncbi:hypothetical protein [Corynebacterium pseudodiphtheriticum]|uniref:hypothetical protein n=1 Tax=Corynebacterium pseudodiphtheriticum TaxID=37637 RepID=UPI002549DC26|nr:hypothetical protein [Corynebacterium pseudodiphtheriticum]MDK8477897.1 hypothetical protein [Corynebacterium pseudodiphtheriticum]MDK8545330.1 hypothetical protein [Corynebacterium pseudodiphtheriticum]MDK8550904.1 hypothetical protein [Corynebacterium pseudodiphtheriticum]MDK8562808.1 hypothetical protein [Corynebacterium pseudodiphtheriticum]MDK8717577.1 hypothetical protein [Corynebacterium pseudodiphtheriticum]
MPASIKAAARNSTVQLHEVGHGVDKFDALVNDISTGLPAEIAAHRKQYEYCRGKLLSFEPAATTQQ